MTRPRALLAPQVRDGLQRLAEPHVVGEHAARAERAQALQPGHPFVLVRAQRGVHAPATSRRCARARQRGERLAPIADARRAALRRRRPSAVAERLFELGDRGGAAERGESQRARRESLAAVELDQHLEELHQPLGREREVAVLVDADRAKARGDRASARCRLAMRRCDSSSRSSSAGSRFTAPAVDLDAQLEAEPVGALVGVHVRVPGQLAVTTWYG